MHSDGKGPAEIAAALGVSRMSVWEGFERMSAPAAKAVRDSLIAFMAAAQAHIGGYATCMHESCDLCDCRVLKRPPSDAAVHRLQRRQKLSRPAIVG